MKRGYPHLTDSQLKALVGVALDRSDSPHRDSSSGGPYGDLIAQAASESASVQELTTMKERAKALIADAADAAHREAAQLLYHVAVAAAFVRHGASISGRPLRKELPVYERLAASWSDDPIGHLFRDALARAARESPPA